MSQMTVMILLIPALLLMLSQIIAMKAGKGFSKKEPFECGFSSMSATRVLFSMRFFMLVVLFLIMDIEISLLLPFLSLIIRGSLFPIYMTWSFMAILLLGVMYEIYEGNFKWS